MASAAGGGSLRTIETDIPVVFVTAVLTPAW